MPLLLFLASLVAASLAVLADIRTSEALDRIPDTHEQNPHFADASHHHSAAKRLRAALWIGGFAVAWFVAVTEFVPDWRATLPAFAALVYCAAVSVACAIGNRGRLRAARN